MGGVITPCSGRRARATLAGALGLLLLVGWAPSAAAVDGSSGIPDPDLYLPFPAGHSTNVNQGPSNSDGSHKPGTHSEYSVDFFAVPGSPVVASAAGHVTHALYDKNGPEDDGGLVVLRHVGGVCTIYAHLSALLVRPGQEVQQGERVGLSGSGGGPGGHLHWGRVDCETRHSVAPVAAVEVGEFADSGFYLSRNRPGGGSSRGARVDRIWGEDRYATAVGVRSVQGSPSSRVYLARADDFADGLSGGTLTDGSILLVPPCGPLPEVVADELWARPAGEVVALGGQSAVCDDVVRAAAAAAGGAAISRLAGADRYATSAAISRSAFADGASSAYLARADAFADALSGGSLRDGPVLLVPSCDELPTSTRDELRRLDANTVTALGGPSAVCDELLLQAGEVAAATTERLSGADRYATSTEIARRTFVDTDQVYLARGDDFADGLVSGTITDGPVLLVPRCGTLPASTSALLDDYLARRVTVLGGEAAVCSTLLPQAA